MKRRGPDSLEGWFIALDCCFIAMLMWGSAGLSSMLFVASIERYNTDREQAAFPYILCSVLQAATGPLAGCLAKRYGERPVVLAGGVLASVGMGICFFAETITLVTVFWGIVFGAGFGLSSLLLPVIINYNFIKHRSKALGLSYLGSPIGFLVFPPIFEVLLNKYGLSGTFLFLSAINLHCIPMSMLLRKPNLEMDLSSQPLCGNEQVTYLTASSRTLRKKPDPPFPSNQRRFSLEFLWQPTSEEQDGNRYCLNLNKNYPFSNSRKVQKARSYEKLNGHFYEKVDKNVYVFTPPSPHCLPKNETGDKSKLKINLKLDESRRTLITEGKKTGRRRQFVNKVKIQPSTLPQEDIEIFNKNKERQRSKFTEIWNEKNEHVYTQFSTIYFGINKKARSINDHFVDLPLKSNSTNGKRTGNRSNILYNHSAAENDDFSNISSTTSLLSSVEANNIPNYNAVSSFNGNSTIRRSDENFHKSLLKIYCNPLFILMSIVNALYHLQFSTLITVIIDFARDHNIDPNNDKFIMMCLSLMGACGMLGFGWVTDGGYMRRNRFASLCLFIGSVTTTILPMTVGFEAFITVLAFWCVSQASFVLLVPAIIADYFHEDVQTVAISACNVLCAPLYFIIPPLIGYFRDGQGSYDNIFYLLSTLTLLNSVSVFIVPCIAKLKIGAINR